MPRALWLILFVSACSSRPAATTWVELRPDGCNCAVTTPVPLLVGTVPEEPPVVSHIFVGFSREHDTEWAVSFNQYPSPLAFGSSKELLDAYAGGMLRALGRKTAERDLTLDGHPGREVELAAESSPDLPGGAIVGRMHLVLAGERSYAVMFLARVNTAASRDRAAQDRFFDSFHLLEPVHDVDPALMPVAWAAHHDDEYGFDVLAPVPDALVNGKEIHDESDALLVGASAKLAVTGWKIKHRGAVYVVRAMTLPPSVASLPNDQLFDSARDDLAKRSQITVTSEEKLSNGRVIHGTVPTPPPPIPVRPWEARAKLVRVGDRLVEIVVVAPDVEMALPDAQAFLDSLKIGEARRGPD